MATPESLESYERELRERDTALGGYCPLDAERLRSADAVRAYGAWLYVLVRSLRAEVVVETGVQNGCSTEMILWAIHRNGKGRLFSIDSGPTSTDGSHQTEHHRTSDGIPGRDILNGLKSHWDLTLGFTRDLLPGVCAHAGSFDLFWHDSDHSHENVRREFQTAKAWIRLGGLLCMHDFSGQETTLTEPEFRLVVPQSQPLLRAWKKIPPERLP